MESFLSQIINFFLQYSSIIIFYLVIIGLVITFRKRIEVQAKIIFLFRTKWGLKAMDKFIAKYREWVILLGYIGAGIGFIGMIMISYLLISNLVSLFFVKGAASSVQLVLPGVNVPGLGVLPFWYWILAIFLIATVHEFSHGIVARAHKIPVKNTGIVLFGPIIGAFVEPDEKKMNKQKDIVQYSILAAGSFSNILLAITALLLFSFVFSPIHLAMTEPAGFSFSDYINDELPAAQVGIPLNTAITSFNGEKITNFQEFSEILFCVNPNENVVMGTDDENFSFTTTENPDNPTKSFLGITGFKNEAAVKPAFEVGIGKFAYSTVIWFKDFFKWLFILSLGIGLFNLLPLPIVDGGRMAQVALHKIKGKNKGEKRYHMISFFFLLVLVFLLLASYLGPLFS